MVESCTICLERPNSVQTEPIILHPVPERPWQVIATDLFIPNNAIYIVAVDYYSRNF